MRTPANIYARIAIALGSYVGYVTVFLLAYRLVGPVITVFSGISLVIIGWVLGVNGSLFFGLINIPLNIFLLNEVGDRTDTFNLTSILLGNFVFMPSPFHHLFGFQPVVVVKPNCAKVLPGW